jgi:hypothetical protein
MKPRGKLGILALTLAIAAGCSSGSSNDSSDRPITSPGARGAIQIVVDPNPIVATNRSGDTYDFPFTVVIRERGGARVEIDRVRLDVLAFGAVNVYSVTYGRDDIVQRGYPTTIDANGELRYSFNPRKEVPDDRIFNGVTGEILAEGRDAMGNPVRSTVSVSVTR